MSRTLLSYYLHVLLQTVVVVNIRMLAIKDLATLVACGNRIATNLVVIVMIRHDLG